jgi:proteasome lid subunit RPN8/RPN11
MPWREAALGHAVRESPREACGLLLVIDGEQQYMPCRNLARDPQDFFILHPDDYADAEEQGEILAIVHSHPHTPAVPSEADLLGCEKSGLPWYIVNPQTSQWGECKPCGYKAPLLGRQWAWGISDCWTLVRDWYAETWRLTLPDWPRPQDLTAFNASPMFEGCWAEAGFVEVSLRTMQVGDAVLMAINAAQPNHVGVYVDDQMLLHHAIGKLSSRDVYGRYYQAKTRRVLRHRSRCQ